MRTAKPCGPGTRCWCQAGGGFSNPTGFRSAANSLATVTRRIRRRGEHGISRKAIAQGMPECSDCTCMLVCVFLCASCTRDRGCSVHPVFPAPSSLSRAKIQAILGHIMPRECGGMSLDRHAPRTRGIQYAAAHRLKSGASGILDRPVIPDRVGNRRRTMTSESCTKLNLNCALLHHADLAEIFQHAGM